MSTRFDVPKPANGKWYELAESRTIAKNALDAVYRPERPALLMVRKELVDLGYEVQDVADGVAVNDRRKPPVTTEVWVKQDHPSVVLYVWRLGPAGSESLSQIAVCSVETKWEGDRLRTNLREMTGHIAIT